MNRSAEFISGKFRSAEGGPVDAPVTVGQRKSLFTAFLGQPLQGFAVYAAERTEGGHLVALIDNGFGRKLNGSDALLSWTVLDPDFDLGTTGVLDRI